MISQGRPVFDGPATNALAHHVHNACWLLSSLGSAPCAPCRVRASLARAREIGSYDTAYIEASFSGVEALFFFSHAVERDTSFVFRVECESGAFEIRDDSKELHGVDWDWPSARTAHRGKLEMYEAFIADPLIFDSAPNSLEDVRAYTLLTNAALVSSRGIRDIPDAQVMKSAAESDPVVVRGLSSVIKRFPYDPSVFHSAGFFWAAPGAWIGTETLHHLDLSDF